MNTKLLEYINDYIQNIKLDISHNIYQLQIS
jgi:hypothetical protein